MLGVGDRFPQFRLRALAPSDAGPGPMIRVVTDKDSQGKWLVIFFWPRDFTPVCATEIVSFGELVSEFEEREAQLLGCSTDSEHAHLDWRLTRPDLGPVSFPMLADVRGDLSGAVGILENDTWAARRGTFIVDPNGIVRSVLVVDFSVGRNTKEVLRVLDALQTDALCPSNWQRGDLTLNVANHPSAPDKSEAS